jgi:hypothetical protein
MGYSNPKVYGFLNDSSEYEHTLKYVVDEIRRRLEKGALQFDSRQALLDALYNSLFGMNITFFVFSLSANDDQLSQWRAYTGTTGRYAIGICSDFLKELGDKNNALLLPVQYGHEYLARATKHLLNEFVKYCEQRDNYEEKVQEAIFEFIDIVNYMAVCCKHAAFAEEAEWRLIVKNYDHAPSNTRARGPYMVPYVRMEFGDLLQEGSPHAKKSPFTIITAPGMDHRRSRIGLGFLELSNSLPRWRILHSRIPYRTD